MEKQLGNGMDGTVWVGWKEGTYADRTLRAQNGAREGQPASSTRLFDTGAYVPSVVLFYDDDDDDYYCCCCSPLFIYLT